MVGERLLSGSFLEVIIKAPYMLRFLHGSYQPYERNSNTIIFPLIDFSLEICFEACKDHLKIVLFNLVNVAWLSSNKIVSAFYCLQYNIYPLGLGDINNTQIK